MDDRFAEHHAVERLRIEGEAAAVERRVVELRRFATAALEQHLRDAYECAERELMKTAALYDPYGHLSGLR